ncbi:DeoR/GlpR family DNA-binding transcription regulator [Alkalibacterium iburiense]|uniref:DeoR/GlpR family DNA-binding transcription regulator n=1 Tax=Alkalibacterium iburiense TaxID=290589 RepID=A0ABN0XUD5_9LACT
MLTVERHQYILNKLYHVQAVTVQELVEELGHSESTIRRDLRQLEEQNQLVRVHGGAKRLRKTVSEASMEEKSVKNSQEKKRIATYASTLIKDKEVIFLDAGTTTYEMIPFLKGKDITVVTNGVPHALSLSEHRIPTILIGGRIKQNTRAIIGPIAEKQLEQFHFSKAFLGMNGVDLTYGLTTTDVEEASIKNKAMNQANQSFVLADHSKLKEVSAVKVADIDDGILITETLSKEFKEFKEVTRVMEVTTHDLHSHTKPVN